MSKKIPENQDKYSPVERRTLLRFLGVAAIAGGGASSVSATSGEAHEASNDFDLIETTIEDAHEAMLAGDLTAVELVEHYLNRIEAYEDDLNTIITLNSDVRERAQKLDDYCAKSGLIGPLHGVPLFVKDNYDTDDLPTTGGVIGFEGHTPPDDAFTVAQLREAGAIVLAKTNLPDFARVAEGLSSVGGQTRNPYDLDRDPGGSSSGTAAGVTSNLALAGTATETGVSIRNPATNNALVGIAPTRGLVSQDGIVPISFTQDRGGPHARTVIDAARLLEVMVGYDPTDPQTAENVDRVPNSYTDTLNEDTLAGARIGVVRELFGDTPAEAEIGDLVDAAIGDMAQEGATIVDPVPIQSVLNDRLPVLNPAFPDDDTSLVRVLSDARTNDHEQEVAMNRYLETREEGFPYETLQDVVDSEEIHPETLELLEEGPKDGLEQPEYHERLLRIKALQSSVLQTMALKELDALVYPMKTQSAPLIGGEYEDATIDGWGNVLSSITGYPSIVVPAGFTDNGLPEAVQFLGQPFTEKNLIELAYAYEQATNHRQPPKDFGMI